MSLRTLINKAGIVYDSSKTDTLFAEDWNSIQPEIDAKQNALGFTPENVANKSTDGTMADNSDTEYPSQKAVKTYADTKQVVSQHVIPLPTVPIGSYNGIIQCNSNVTGYVGLVNFREKITANKISFYCSTVTTSGVVNVALFSADGQTRIFSAVSASILSPKIVTISLSGIVIPPGQYWIFVAPVGTASMNLMPWSENSVTALDPVSGSQYLQGKYTVSAGIVPATLTLASILTYDLCTLMVRFDN